MFAYAINEGGGFKVDRDLIFDVLRTWIKSFGHKS